MYIKEMEARIHHLTFKSLWAWCVLSLWIFYTFDELHNQIVSPFMLIWKKSHLLCDVLFQGGQGKGVAAGRVLRVCRINSVLGSETCHPCTVLVGEKQHSHHQLWAWIASSSHKNRAFEFSTKNRSCVLGLKFSSMTSDESECLTVPNYVLLCFSTLL